MGIHFPAGVNLGGRAGIQLGRGVGVPGPPSAGLILRISATSVAGFADGASVAFGDIPDLSAAGNNPTSTTGITKVTGVNGKAALNFAGTQPTIAMASGFAVDAQNHTVYVLSRMRNSSGNQDNGAWLDFGSSPENMLWWSGSGYGIFTGSSNLFGSQVLPGNQQFTVDGYRAGATDVEFFINNFSSNAGSALPSGTRSGGRIGSRPGGGFDFSGDMQEILVYDHVHTDLEKAAVMTWFGTPSYTKQIICDGSSLTALAFSNPITSTLFVSWPWVLQGSIPLVKVFNFGVSGQTLQTSLSNVASRINQYVDGSRFTGGTYAIMFAPPNDFLAGRTEIQFQSDFNSYCSSVKGAGIKMIATTMVSSGGFDVTMEAGRQTFNTWLRANPSVYDALADVDANTPVGGVGTFANTTYYAPDQLHFTAVGASALEVEILRAYNTI